MQRLFVATVVVVLVVVAARIGDAQTFYGLSCGPTTGLSGALPVCSESSPCFNLSSSDAGLDNISSTSTVPTCGGFSTLRRSVVDPSGVTRYWCVREPPTATEPLPLVVFFHGAFSTANDVLITGFNTQFNTYTLSAHNRKGFYVASIQGRNLHWPTADPRDGAHHDYYYRDMRSNSGNPDVWLADKIIDDYVDAGKVDNNQIYLVGWSNGGFFSQFYGIARDKTPTPGGNYITAIIAYTAANPFGSTTAGQDPSCELDPYPQSNIPIMLISNDCDIIPCDDAQAQALTGTGYIPPPGSTVDDWNKDLEPKVGNTRHSWTIVTATGSVTTKCNTNCGIVAATANHVTWPAEQEDAMFSFLKKYTRSNSADTGGDGGGDGGAASTLQSTLCRLVK